MAITDLTGTSWLFPLVPNFPQDYPFHGANINFTTNNESYGYLDVGNEQNAYIYYGAVDAYTSADGWSDPAYRKIIITGGTDATDPYVIDYFTEYATDITPNLQLKDKTGTPQTYAVTAGKVNIPNAAGGTTKFSLPSADQLEILANGVFDVSQYGSAKVDVPTGGGDGQTKKLLIESPLHIFVPNQVLIQVGEDVTTYHDHYATAYDGQNESGTSLGAILSNTTVQCKSGYIYLEGNYEDSIGVVSGNITYQENGLFKVDGNGTIYYNASCFVKGTPIVLADRSTKPVENITYDDELLVWNFYEGKLDTAKPIWIMEKRTTATHKKVTLSNGIVLNLVGSGEKCHRLFNVTKQKMLYANECVGDEVYTLDGVATVLSCEIIKHTVDFYNLTTEKYLDCFANGVLTGSRLNNMYHIADMKYDSDERLISEEEETERWKARGMETPKFAEKEVQNV